MEKKCSTCGQIKPVQDFSINRQQKDGRRCRCKECSKLHRNNPETRNKELSYGRKYYQENKVHLNRISRDNNLFRKYGVTRKQYNAILESQNGVCAICGLPETKIILGEVARLAVDHCHKTGKIRGLLCGKCNTGISSLGDNLDILASASSYLINSDI